MAVHTLKTYINDNMLTLIFNKEIRILYLRYFEWVI